MKCNIRPPSAAKLAATKQPANGRNPVAREPLDDGAFIGYLMAVGGIASIAAGAAALWLDAGRRT